MEKRKSKHFLLLENNEDDAFLTMRAFRAIPFCTLFVAREIQDAQAYLTGLGPYADRLSYPLPDAILTHFQIGKESALPFITWLSASFGKIPVFILTGGTRPEETEKAYRLGVKEVIQKPAGLHALRELFNRLASDLCEETPPSSPRPAPIFWIR